MNKIKEKSSILIVDDEKNTRDGLERALRNTYNVFLAENAERALKILGESRIDVLLTDVRMPGMDGLTLLQRALGSNPGLVCIILTAYGNVETAVEAMKRGAYDFLMKPVNLDHLDLILTRALHSRDIESENVNLRVQLDDKYEMENIIGNSRAMQQLFDVIRQAAPAQATVLIQGESGTGKELVAHAIHRLSTRTKGPFVAVHCAALSSNLLESELFGHEKGAFTGAAAQRRGRFELADGGSLFLDEISEIDASVQVKLLRVLEEREFERVGGAEKISVDIRLITATNKDLKTLVKEGKFREDLFFRLDVVNINLPPLRDRLDDIPILCNHFLKEFSEKNEKKIDGITPDAIKILSEYSWPGNVRELRNTIEKMVVLARGPKLSARDIPQNVRDFTHSKMTGDVIKIETGIGGNAGSIAGAEKALIAATLKKFNGNRTKAAVDLGISRRTLHRKLREYEKEGTVLSIPVLKED
ncbi:MAG: sigma-54 dependent transcriptional regulator [Kiritimatiellae bacterium]|nr:sigma-54 dependent transcriptional regulator [Kiritimatiellia bacterium]MDD5520351.1 sigma-54 dependent transcriptional regulator [Kiritimatiellia bacterium]